MTKEVLINLIQKSTSIRLYISLSSPNDSVEDIPTGELNDYVLNPDGSLELWCNSGYEI